MKKRFAIIGSGWRAEFYIRIALHPGNDFELTGLLCRNTAKQEALAKKYGISPTLFESEIIESRPDFIVVAVSKPSIAEVSAHWQEMGFPVLCETPAALNLRDLSAIVQRSAEDAMPLLVAEQYQYYDTYQKLLELIQSGIIGQTVSASISLAHDYHGVSLLRQILMEPYSAPYRILVQKHELPVTKTGDRYQIYTEGELIRRTRTIAQIAFQDGRIALYDFDPEQYHSVIRHNRVHVTGTRGEIINETLWYLDDKNEMQQRRWTEDLQAVREPGADAKLSQDEAAILCLMEQVWQVSQAALGKAECTPKIRQFQEENLRSAVADTCFMLLLQAGDGTWMESYTI